MDQEPWYIRLGIYWIFTIGSLLGLALIGLLAFLLHWQPGLWAGLGITLGSGITSAAAILAWIFLTPAPTLGARDFPAPVPLRTFLDDPEAVIAPNLHPDACDRLAGHHGEDSVWVLPLPDGPFSDRVVLAVPALSSADIVALKRFDIDSIEELSEETRSKVFPLIERSRKLVEIAWD